MLFPHRSNVGTRWPSYLPPVVVCLQTRPRDRSTGASMSGRADHLRTPPLRLPRIRSPLLGSAQCACLAAYTSSTSPEVRRIPASVAPECVHSHDASAASARRLPAPQSRSIHVVSHHRDGLLRTGLRGCCTSYRTGFAGFLYSLRFMRGRCLVASHTPAPQSGSPPDASPLEDHSLAAGDTASPRHPSPHAVSQGALDTLPPLQGLAP